MLYNEPSPLETKVLTRRFGLPNSASIDTYLANDGYKAFVKAAAMTPEDDHRRSEDLESARPRRRGISDRHEVELRAAQRRPSRSTSWSTRDESEPGTCKDRVLIENDPHQLIEGC